MKVQKKLNNLYKRYWTDLSRLRNENKELHNPLLINIPEGYTKQTNKLIVFGQQTRKWCEKSQTIPEIISCYKQFNLGENLNFTPFWNFIRKIENILNIEHNKIVWNNLNKCAYNQNRPPKKLEEKVIEIFPVIKDEIKIINPDIVIFLSGPNFDRHIKKILTGCSFIRVNGLEGKKLSKIVHPILPEKSFRTYHPHFLRRKKMEETILKEIKKKCT